MKLAKYKEKNSLTYQALAEKLGISKTLTFYLCKGPYSNLRAADALRIEKSTDCKVTVEELCK